MIATPTVRHNGIWAISTRGEDPPCAGRTHDDPTHDRPEPSAVSYMGQPLR